jgi:peroxiredoxin Q/BCP
MTRHLALAGSALAAAAILVAAGRLAAAELKPGDPAPKFSLPGNDDKTYKLEDFKDKKVVVVAWYPKAFTGG